MATYQIPSRPSYLPIVDRLPWWPLISLLYKQGLILHGICFRYDFRNFEKVKDIRMIEEQDNICNFCGFKSSMMEAGGHRYFRH